MCPEVFEIVQKMDISSVETRLALQCAPVITGIKQANLLIVSSEDERFVGEVLRETGIQYFCLYRKKKKCIYFVFRIKEFEAYMQKKEVAQVLLRLGYKDLSINEVITAFQKRYEAYMQHDSCFPHEIGLLLGYPIEDVEGFIANKGKNYLYAGYWKVYENVEEKKLLFEAYESAKDGVLLLVANGYEMKSIIRGIQSSKNPKDWMPAIKKQK